MSFYSMTEKLTVVKAGNLTLTNNKMTYRLWIGWQFLRSMDKHQNGIATLTPWNTLTKIEANLSSL